MNPLVANNNRPGVPWTAWPKLWWTRFTARCAGSACPKQGKLWPYWLHHCAGLEFDGRWYCSRACFEPLVLGRIHALLSSFQSEKPRAYRLPLGLLLVNRGAISVAQLREALRCQREAGHGRVGDWLRQTAALTAQQLTAALGQQWGCPVFPLDTQEPSAAWTDLIPLPLLESANSVPAHASPDARVLHLAFGERVDHTLLYAVEQMLFCRTFPCVASASAVQHQLERFRKLTAGNSTAFDTVRESSEMAWTVCNYAVELHPQRIALARAGAYIWARFFGDQSSRDLLFRILPESSAKSLERPWDRAKAFSLPADGRKVGVSHAATQS
jgi:hypothetical protein